MADTKITGLAAIGANPIIPSTFPLPMVDLTDTSMAASGTTKKVTVNQILGAGGIATLASATITGDLTVDTSTLKVDSTNNRVGIGTASPSYSLDVVSAGGVVARVQNTASTADAYFQAQNTAGSGFFGINATGQYMYTSASIPLLFYTAGSERARIDSSGNLGLGVTPSAGGSQFYKTFELGKAGCGLFAATAVLTGSELTYLSGNGVLKYNAGPEWSYGNAGSAAIYGIEDGVHKWFNAGSGSAGGVFVPTQAMTLNANGCLALQGGNTSATGVGIAFPATQAASSDANTLDDYEEGTWTPVVTAGSGTLTTVTGQTGSYTKIGRMVQIVFYFEITTNGTGASFVAVAGLPFTNNGTLASIAIGRRDGVDGKLMQGKISIGTATCNIWLYDNAYPGTDGAQFPMVATYYV